MKVIFTRPSAEEHGVYGILTPGKDYTVRDDVGVTWCLADPPAAEPADADAEALMAAELSRRQEEARKKAADDERAKAAAKKQADEDLKLREEERRKRDTLAAAAPPAATPPAPKKAAGKTAGKE